MTAIVALGASLGGLRAVGQVLRGLPAAFDAALVVVQHRRAEADALLAPLLARGSQLPVCDAEDKQPLRTGHVYVAPSDYHLLVEEDGLHLALSTEAPVGHARPSIDVLLESLARSRCPTAVAVLLTGASGDGAWGAEVLQRLNPRLITVAHKGFLPGPYEHRTALDEVVQMMGGLAYMTGRPGDPLRAGTSVNDIMGGMFGAIGALGALIQRGITGKGQEVQSALFENNVFLVGQHMLQYAITGQAAAPMPERISAWAVYDVFTVKDGEQIFLAAVSDAQWQTFCDAMGYADLKADTGLATNNDRVRARPTLMPVLRERLAQHTADELAAIFERHGLPFAPIRRPEELFDDPHLNQTGGLAPLTLADGRETRVPLLPLTLDGQRLPLRSAPPALGQHSRELLRELGYSDEDMADLLQAGVIAEPEARDGHAG